MDEFVTWFLREKGWLDTESMGLVEIPGQERGAVALKDILDGHTLFTIPRNLTLSTRTSELPRLVGESAWKSCKLHKGWVGLILCMIWEESRRQESKWSGYLDSLPKIFDTPMFWNEEELKELEGTAVLGKIGKEDAERDYDEKLVPAVQSRPDLFDPAHLKTYYSLENYHRMGSRILSRSFQVERWQGEDDDGDEEEGNAQPKEQENGQKMEVDGEGADGRSDVELGNEEEGDNDSVANEDDEESDEDEDDTYPSDVAMVPMADMLNARYGSENAKLFYEPLELKMVTTKPIKKGEQIYNTYGDPPNSELLRRYGHVDLVPLSDPDLDLNDSSRRTGEELGNPADVVEIRADLVVEVVSSNHENSGEHADAMKERIDWWLEEGGDDIFVLGTDFDLPDAVISFLKLLLLPKPEWEKTRAKGKPPKPKLDRDNDAKVKILPLILEVLERRLGEYPTTLDHDESLLTNFNLDPPTPTNTRLFNALVVRIGEKRILKGCASKYKSVLEGARAAAAEAEAEAESMNRSRSRGKDRSKDRAVTAIANKNVTDQKKRKRGKESEVEGGDGGEKARKRAGR